MTESDIFLKLKIFQFQLLFNCCLQFIRTIIDCITFFNFDENGEFNLSNNNTRS